MQAWKLWGGKALQKDVAEQIEEIGFGSAEKEIVSSECKLARLFPPQATAESNLWGCFKSAAVRKKENLRTTVTATWGSESSPVQSEAFKWSDM